MGGRAGAPRRLWQAELGVVGDDDIGVAYQSDAAADTEAVDRRDHGNLALVHRAERVEATTRLASMSAVKPSVFCISLMSTPVEAAPSARRITTWVAVAPCGGDGVAEFEPAPRWIAFTGG